MTRPNLLLEFNRRGLFRVAGAYLVSAWAIAKMAELGLEKFSAPEWGMKVVLILLMIGFPVVLTLSWIHNLAAVSLDLDLGDGVDSAGGRIAHPDGTEETQAASNRRKSTVHIILAVGVALALLALGSWINQQQAMAPDDIAADQRTSIAVLPFSNLGGNIEDEFLSDGLAEELLNLLVRIPELRVISRSSAFSFKGRELDAPIVASELGVDHILEGSVRKAGDQVRINTRLVDAASNTQIWSETFDRRIDDVFAIQDEIADAVIDELKLVLLSKAPSTESVPPEAYTLFLQGRHLSRLGSQNAIQQGIEKLQQSVAIDSGYSDAWSELGLNQIRRARLPNVPENQAFAEAQISLSRAVNANPVNATAHSRLAWLAMSGGNLELAAQQTQLAIDLEPGNVVVLVNAAQLLSQLDRHDEAVQLYEQALLLDPTSPSVHWNYSESLWAIGEIEDSLRRAELAIGFGPDYLGIHYTIGTLHLYLGKYSEALAAFESEGSEDLRAAGVAMALYALGRQAEFNKALAAAVDRWGEERPSAIANIFLWTGDLDEGFAWMQRARVTGDRRLFLLLQNPLMEQAREDPRWESLLEELGRSPERLASIRLENPF